LGLIKKGRDLVTAFECAGNKKAVKIPEVLHGFDFNLKESAAENPPCEVPPPPVIKRQYFNHLCHKYFPILS
jgi:hypothetical protein